MNVIVARYRSKYWSVRLGFFVGLIALCMLLPQAQAYEIGPEFEDPADFPLMGDWIGEWIDPQKGHEENNPELAAQLLPMGNGEYKVVIIAELFKRAVPYAEFIVPESDGRIEIDQDGWQAVFEEGEAHGEAPLHGDTVQFRLTQTELLSPTLGKAAPEGAVVLFDGSHYDHWEHKDGRDVTWIITDEGAMEVVSGFWDDKAYEEAGLGGDIITKDRFREFDLHVEFRYPVEPDLRGQRRGNSGLFVDGVGELQILNSYTTFGYWDEQGALYKMYPARVNASAPPLQWQTYDVTVRFPEGRDDAVLLTAYLNGHRIHHEWEVATGESDFHIFLQDHINRIQFRNIWIRPLD